MVYYTGWEIPKDERQRLLELVTPKYKRVIAHHITFEYDVKNFDNVPSWSSKANIIGIADDDAGVQALVVEMIASCELYGTMTHRPDDKRYHITLSLAPGRDAVDSNDVIKSGWKIIHLGLINVVPKLFGS